MEQPSQSVLSEKSFEKPNSESETERLARQWVELVLEQLQHQKYMNKKQEWQNNPCQ